MSSIGKRSKNAVKNQLSNTSNQSIKHNTIYIGFVKDNSDAMMMNRLRVWIPELSPDSVNGLYTVNWCSPFAGATPVASNDATNSSQVSYGLWFSPPDIDNEVVVMFANGDPNRGIYIGGLYQQNMNHMVPGIPSSTLTNSTDKTGEQAPSQEYNKKDKDIASKQTGHSRPTYNNLVDALINQGLITDDNRGTSTSGARRSPVSKVTGILTPGGNQFVMDDDDDNKFIRLRTQNGTQIVVNDNIGMIYMITKSGNSWLEISDDGIEAYTTGNYSVRCHGDYNIHADGDINMFSGKYTNMASAEGISMSADQSFSLIAANTLSIAAGGQISLLTTADLCLQGAGDIGVDSGGTLALRACSAIGMTACDKVDMKAAKINMNTNTPATPIGPIQPNVKQSAKISDRTVASGGDGIKTKTTSIVSTLPTHEPYAGHPTSNPGAATVTPNDNITDASSATGSSSTNSTSTANTTETSTNNEKWKYPLTGKVLMTYAEDTIGTKISGTHGQTIICPRKGNVLWAGQSMSNSSYSGNGLCVVVDHLDKTYSLFGNLSATSVNKGDSVIQGQTIGRVGEINNISQLHYEIRQNGNAVDPKPYLPKLAIAEQYIIAGSN